MAARYSIELVEFSRSGVIEDHILARENDLNVAQDFYRFWANQLSNRVVVLADRARILARSDCP